MHGHIATKRALVPLGRIGRDMVSVMMAQCFPLPAATPLPFGTQWYPYLMRRLAERPANLAFMTGNIVKEMFGGSKSGSGAAGNGTRSGARNDTRNGAH